jgi:hypothetical protein
MLDPTPGAALVEGLADHSLMLADLDHSACSQVAENIKSAQQPSHPCDSRKAGLIGLLEDQFRR